MVGFRGGMKRFLASFYHDTTLSQIDKKYVVSTALKTGKSLFSDNGDRMVKALKKETEEQQFDSAQQYCCDFSQAHKQIVSSMYKHACQASGSCIGPLRTVRTPWAWVFAI